MMPPDFPQPHWLSANYSIWILAIALSLSAHALLLLKNNTYYQAAPAMVNQETITQVRFANISPPPVTVIEHEVNESPSETRVVPPENSKPKLASNKSEPRVEKKVPLKKTTPEKIKIVKKQRVKQVIVSTQKKPTTKKIRPKPTASALNDKPKINQAIKASPIISQSDQRLLEQTRKNYQALLMRHIEVQKHYPRIARKRRIEGKIIVSFTLFANGEIKNLKINGQRSILNKASKNAVLSALPMPKPPKDLSMPMAVKFAMNYFLN